MFWTVHGWLRSVSIAKEQREREGRLSTAPEHGRSFLRVGARIMRMRIPEVEEEQQQRAEGEGRREKARTDAALAVRVCLSIQEARRERGLLRSCSMNTREANIQSDNELRSTAVFCNYIRLWFDENLAKLHDIWLQLRKCGSTF